MSTLKVVESDDQVQDAPVAYVGDGWVEAENIRSREAQLVAAADQMGSAEEIGLLCQSVFDLGVAVWTLSQSRQISADLSVQVDRFRTEVQTATATAVTAIGEQVATVTEPDTGVLASAVEREIIGLKKAGSGRSRQRSPSLRRWPPLIKRAAASAPSAPHKEPTTNHGSPRFLQKWHRAVGMW